MPTNVIMPQMGESIFEGTLTRWLKKPGDKIQRDEPLFEISTDKVDAEIPAPAAGVLSKILVPEGQTVQINTVVGEITEEGEAVQAAPAEPAAPPKVESSKAEPPKPAAAPPKAEPAEPAAAAPERPSQAEAQPLPGAEEPPARSVVEFPQREPSEEIHLAARGESRSSPLVRKLAAEHGVDLNQVPGTGLGGRITKSDMVSFIEKKGGKVEEAPAEPTRPAPPPRPAAPPSCAPTAAQQPAPPAPRQAPPQAAPARPAAAAQAAPGDRIEIVPMSTMRQKIADHMVEARRTAAHVHNVFRVDLTRIVKLRESMKAEFESRNGVKLTYMPFITRAAVSALKAFPWVNATLDGANLLVKKDVNVGIAVALENGLIVPVIKNADEKSFLGVARAIRDVADRARSKRLSPDEVHGGTFTITNPGQYGALFGLPIIPVGTLAIMGVGSIQKTPVVIDEAIAIRSVVHLSLGYDHRVIDGALADQFMAHVKQTLENWEEPIL